MIDRNLICMMGLPRSGKTTAARKLSRILGAPIVNRDSIRLALHGQRYQKLAEPMVKAVALVMVRALFEAGHHTVIVDETNLKRSTRDFWRGGDWVTSILSVATNRDVCLRRAEAAGDEDIQPVIRDMADGWQTLDMDEGRYPLNQKCRTNTDLVEVVESIQESMDGEDIKEVASDGAAGLASRGTCSGSSE